MTTRETDKERETHREKETERQTERESKAYTEWHDEAGVSLQTAALCTYGALWKF